MRLSNRNLRLCVLNRFLDRKLPTHPAVAAFECQRVASDIGELDAQLGQSLTQAFKNRDGNMPIDQAMEIVDLYLKQRTEP